jgi:hypothetical protein
MKYSRQTNVRKRCKSYIKNHPYKTVIKDWNNRDTELKFITRIEILNSLLDK